MLNDKLANLMKERTLLNNLVEENYNKEKEKYISKYFLKKFLLTSYLASFWKKRKILLFKALLLASIFTAYCQLTNSAKKQMKGQQPKMNQELWISFFGIAK